MPSFNFAVPLINIDGKESPTQKVSDTMAELLGTETEGNTQKIYGWYKALQVGEPLLLDEADSDTLKKLFGDSNKRVYVYVKGQILDIIKNTIAADEKRKASLNHNKGELKKVTGS